MTTIFMHLEHTGGTTLKQVILRQYPPENVFTFYKLQKNPVGRFMQMRVEERSRYQALIGHLYYGLHRWVPGDAMYVTFLRDPLERMVSSYYYLARAGEDPSAEAYKSGRITLQEHVKKRPWNSIAQVARIAGGDDTLIQKSWIPALAPDALELAKQHLDSHFIFIGLQEYYDESLLMMKKVLGWKQPVLYVRRNSAENRPKFNDLPEEDRQMIREAVRQEIELYDYAKLRFEQQLNAQGDTFQQEVTAFKAQNRVYTEPEHRMEKIKAPVSRFWRGIKRAIRG